MIIPSVGVRGLGQEPRVGRCRRLVGHRRRPGPDQQGQMLLRVHVASYVLLNNNCQWQQLSLQSYKVVSAEKWQRPNIGHDAAQV